MLGGLEAWIPDLLGTALPSESKATCHACAMLPPADAGPRPDSVYFTPAVRCCTYEPSVPNYLVGRVLRDDSAGNAHGRATMHARLTDHSSVSPLSVSASARFVSLYRAGSELFGQATDLACMHLLPDGTGCGIWAHRNTVCATWHCKHERGQRGRELWLALEDVGREIEFVLMLWCARTLDVPSAAFAIVQDTGARALRAADLGGQPDDTSYRARWGAWEGREREYFVRCAELVDPLQFTDIQRLGGERLAVLIARLREASAALDAPVPDALEVGPLSVRLTAAGTMQINTYSAYDPLQAPARLLSYLPYFDGRPIAEAREAIREAHHVVLTDELVQRLIDYQILRAP